jgi:hypothetical protein
LKSPDIVHIANHRIGIRKGKLKYNSAIGGVNSDSEVREMTKINKFVEKKHQFQNIGDAQRFVRAHGTPDYMAIDGVLYTMEEYDMNGQELFYGNRRRNKTLSVSTVDRYTNGFGDAKLEVYDACSYRNDIHYAD